MGILDYVWEKAPKRCNRLHLLVVKVGILAQHGLDDILGELQVSFSGNDPLLNQI